MAEDQQPRSLDDIAADLRAQFEPLLERLTPDIEPATVYSPAVNTSSENKAR